MHSSRKRRFARFTPGRRRSSSIIPRFFTSGEVFPDGSLLDLIRDPASAQLSLVFNDGAEEKNAQEITAHGCVFVPIEVSPSLLDATILPDRQAPYGSTAELFTACRELFASHGFSQPVARLCAHFAFASWFPETFAIAPCVAIMGPKAEAFALLQLLGCLVRRPLRVGSLDRAVLSCLPPGWAPTILIDHEPEPRTPQSLLQISSHRGSHLVVKGKLVDAFSLKAMYLGPALGDHELGPGTLLVSVGRVRDRLPILDAETQLRISAEFQPKFLAYRMANFTAVKNSEFDAPNCSTEVQIWVRSFGTCIVDAPEIEADLKQLAQGEEEQARIARWHDPQCVLVEAILFFCHARKRGKVYVGEIAKYAETISRARGDDGEVQPRRVGAILRSLGLNAKRDGAGRSILLTENVRQQVHQLARDFEVASLEVEARCELCVDVLRESGETNEKESKTDG